MHATDFIALEAAALTRQACGPQLVLPAWPHTVDAVADAIDRQQPSPLSGGRRTRTLIRLLDELGDLLSGVYATAAATFAHTISALADRRWEQLPAPSPAERG